MPHMKHRKRQKAKERLKRLHEEEDKILRELKRCLEGMEAFRLQSPGVQERQAKSENEYIIRCLSGNALPKWQEMFRNT